MNGLIVDLFAGGGQHTPAESGENSSHGTRCFRAPRHKVCYEKGKARRGTGLRHMPVKQKNVKPQQ